MLGRLICIVIDQTDLNYTQWIDLNCDQQIGLSYDYSNQFNVEVWVTNVTNSERDLLLNCA